MRTPRSVHRAVRLLLHPQEPRHPAKTLAELTQRPVDPDGSERGADALRDPVEAPLGQTVLDDQHPPEPRRFIPPGDLRNVREAVYLRELMCSMLDRAGVLDTDQMGPRRRKPIAVEEYEVLGGDEAIRLDPRARTVCRERRAGVATRLEHSAFVLSEPAFCNGHASIDGFVRIGMHQRRLVHDPDVDALVREKRDDPDALANARCDQQVLESLVGRGVPEGERVPISQHDAGLGVVVAVDVVGELRGRPTHLGIVRCAVERCIRCGQLRQLSNRSAHNGSSRGEDGAPSHRVEWQDTRAE